MFDDILIRQKLHDKGLKITPQRLVVLQTIMELGNHPSADQIISVIREKHPNIATGTIYNILDTLADKKIIERVKTDRDIMRYDGDTSDHHHLYCSENSDILDYYDEDLNNWLAEYFKDSRIKNFSIESIRLQIVGKKINGDQSNA